MNTMDEIIKTFNDMNDQLSTVFVNIGKKLLLKKQNKKEFL